ncbi:MAG TPA: glycosyltransferase family 4 protein [Myxococcota bacterium]
MSGRSGAGSSQGRRALRVALLTNLLSPYRLPVYRDLAATPGWQLRVLVGAESNRDWARAYAGAHARGSRELDVEVVRSWSVRQRVATHRAGDAVQSVEIQLPFGALGALRRFRPDVVVSGELGARTALAALYARLARVPLVIWSYQSRAWAAAASPARRAWRRALLARAGAVVGMGIQAREVLRSLGVPEAKLFDAPNAHDHERLASALAHCDTAALRAVQHASLGCREHVALVAGRLVASKGVRPLLAAWRALDPALRAEWTLLFVGDGPLRGEVEAAAATATPGEIACTGAVAADDMADFYAGADLLVFPSLGDPWGLVVNEALACGVPVLCSALAGCAEDLVEPGENGWRFDPLDAEGFRSALDTALRCADRSRMGRNARDAAKRFAPEGMAEGFRRAVRHAARISG